MIRVTIFSEFLQEKTEENVKAVYPDGIHMALKKGIESEEFVVKTVTLDDENCGINEDVLKNTDVMLWWGHLGHDKVSDEVASKVKEAVNKGMGIIFLHSAHHSKPFKMLMGSSCNLSWREDGDRELLWACNPSHPIANGVDRFVYIENEETYGEPFGVPEPDELVFIANFEGGEVMRAGCCWKREYGKVFYFQPGHETFPIYYKDEILNILKNAIRWANSSYRADELECPHVKKPLEE